jgi:protein-tyrosine-phosphatase
MVAVERILVVCTANRCRSPLAAALLREQLADRGSAARVGSAGLGDAGMAATSGTVEVAKSLGLDLTEHRSRAVAARLLARADLILGMERYHVREVVLLDARTWHRTFTLKELVRRGEATGPRAAGEGIRGWAAKVGAGRDRSEMLGESLTDDVADPTGGDVADHERTAEELHDLVTRFVDLAWPR